MADKSNIKCIIHENSYFLEGNSNCISIQQELCYVNIKIN